MVLKTAFYVSRWVFWRRKEKIVGSPRAYDREVFDLAQNFFGGIVQSYMSKKSVFLKQSINSRFQSDFEKNFQQDRRNGILSIRGNISAIFWKITDLTLLELANHGGKRLRTEGLLLFSWYVRTENDKVNKVPTYLLFLISVLKFEPQQSVLRSIVVFFKPLSENIFHQLLGVLSILFFFELIVVLLITLHLVFILEGMPTFFRCWCENVS